MEPKPNSVCCHCCSSRVLRENENDKIRYFLEQRIIHISGLISSRMLNKTDTDDLKELKHMLETLTKVEEGYYFNKMHNSTATVNTTEIDATRNNMDESIALSNMLTTELYLTDPDKYHEISNKLKFVQHAIANNYKAAGY